MPHRPSAGSAPTRLLPALVLAALALPAAPASALEECRLMRQPDIQGGTIVFVYAGDLWTVPRAGGVAARLTAHDGIERFPKLSPDGKTVAFTGENEPVPQDLEPIRELIRSGAIR